MVYAKRPFAGPEQVLDYLGRYTHRIAISNQRLCSLHDDSVRFRYTDYRRAGASRKKTMTLTATEFIRRMLLHVLPPGFFAVRVTAVSPVPPAQIRTCALRHTAPSLGRLKASRRELQLAVSG